MDIYNCNIMWSLKQVLFLMYRKEMLFLCIKLYDQPNLTDPLTALSERRIIYIMCRTE